MDESGKSQDPEESVRPQPPEPPEHGKAPKDTSARQEEGAAAAS